MTMRIGTGFDVHGFADERALVIGGVTIAHPRGLAGHSDADVLLLTPDVPFLATRWRPGDGSSVDDVDAVVDEDVVDEQLDDLQ